MSPLRRRGALAAALLLLLLAPPMAVADGWPSRPIRLIVPTAAGTGVTDMMARLIAPELGAALGQSVVVDNRPGASGILGTDIAAKAAPDGHTLLMVNIAMAVNVHLYPKLPFDPVGDFLPVTMVNSAPLVLVVHPSVPVQSVAELIALAKAQPGKLNFASGGVGSTPHMAGELFAALAHIDVVHVPYRSGAPALSDLVAGQVTFMLENVPGTMPFVRAGKLRALGVTSAQRSAIAPELPTLAEAGVPGYEIIGWNGLMAIKGTPRDIVGRLHDEVARILRTPAMAERFAALGAEPVGDTPAAFGAFLRSETARWGAIIKEKGIRAE